MNKLTLLFVLLIYSLSFGQEYWRNYNSATSRLPNNTVYKILIDDQDIKWFATGVGVGKFDGTNWTVYNKSNSGLPNNTVRCLAIDSKGDKWIGTDSGLVKFDGKSWTVYTKSNSYLPDDRIRGVAVDKEGFIWIGTKQGGVARFDGYNWRLFNSSNTSGLVNEINTVAVDVNNIKWIGTSGGGLGKFDGVNWTFYTKLNSYTACNSFLCIEFDPKGVMWACTWNGGLEMFDGTKWGWASYFPKITRKLEHKWMLGVAIDHSGAKWVGANNIGLWKFETVNGIDTWSAFDSLNSPVKDTCVVSLAVDKYNNKWIGTYTKGLYIYNENGIVIKNLSVAGPEGGAKWAAGSKQRITWSSNGISGNVNIKLSLDEGATYPVTLASGTPNDGSEEITIPQNHSDLCRIKIESAQDPTVYGVSSSNFSIIILKAPVLLSPKNAAFVDPSKVILKWHKTELAEAYALKVATDTSFSVLLRNEPSIADTVLQLLNLSSNMKCYWKVQARITGGTGPWSETQSFSILSLPVTPVLQSPVNNAVNIEENTTLSWGATQNAASYSLNISEDDQFSTYFYSDSGLTGLNKELKGLKHGAKYYWQVMGKNASGAGPYSAIWNFITKLYRPDSLELSVRAEGLGLTWKDKTNNESGFVIEKNLGSGFNQIATVGPNQTSYIDKTAIEVRCYQYRVRAFTSYAESDFSYAGICIDAVKDQKRIPSVFALEQNYPNPFNPSTRIKYSIPKESFVSLRVFNMLGCEVAELVNGKLPAGDHEAVFDGSSLPSGMYLYRLEAGDNVSIKKLVLLK
ncbi:MAG: two-component regulator propeller domain-containing protein [Syntrophomonadaceae bacterium]